MRGSSGEVACARSEQVRALLSLLKFAKRAHIQRSLGTKRKRTRLALSVLAALRQRSCELPEQKKMEMRSKMMERREETNDESGNKLKGKRLKEIKRANALCSGLIFPLPFPFPSPKPAASCNRLEAAAGGAAAQERRFRPNVRSASSSFKLDCAMHSSF